jgi:hypothetical protein
VVVGAFVWGTKVDVVSVLDVVGLLLGKVKRVVVAEDAVWVGVLFTPGLALVAAKASIGVIAKAPITATAPSAPTATAPKRRPELKMGRLTPAKENT